MVRLPFTTVSKTEMKEAYSAADEILEELQKNGIDYSKHRQAIANSYWYGLLEGNDEVTVSLTDSGLQDLRIIQEDHYDQHMDDDESRPDSDEMLCYVCVVPSYVWLV